MAEFQPVSRKVFGMMVLVNVVWGPVNFFVIEAKRAGFSAAGLDICRWSLIAIGLSILLLTPKVRQKVALNLPNWKIVLLAFGVGGLFSGTAHLIYYQSLGKVGTVEGTILTAMSPLFVGLLSGFVLRERVHMARWASLVCGGLGAYIATVGISLPMLQSSHLQWDGLYMFATFLEATGGIFLTVFARKSSGLAVLAAEALGIAFMGLLIGLLDPSGMPIHFAGASLAGWASIGYLAICAGVFTFGTWMIVVESVPLSLMVATLAIQAPVAAVFGYLFLHEKLTLNMLFGTTLIFAALFVLSKDKHAMEPT